MQGRQAADETFGCAGKARRLAEHFASGGNAHNPPEGFTYLSSGAYRHAFLHVETNIVYKVDRDHDIARTGEMGSHNEHINASKARKHEWKFVRIPMTALFKFGNVFIIAMEAATGVIGHDSCANYGAALREVSHYFGDMHGANYFYDEDKNVIIPIDMGCLNRNFD